MKKIKVNPRVMKKVILFSLLGLVVIILGYAVVSSFISKETTKIHEYNLIRYIGNLSQGKRVIKWKK